MPRCEAFQYVELAIWATPSQDRRDGLPPLLALTGGYDTFGRALWAPVAVRWQSLASRPHDVVTG